jgi:hypothetical protein
MKKIIMNTKYVWLLLIALGLTTACSNDDDSSNRSISTPPLSSGTADFSTYVSLGNSLTSGFSDGALFIAVQENSFPNILAEKFSMLGGGSFTQPLMNDNIGGLIAAGNPVLNPITGENVFPPRFYADLSGDDPAPVRLDANSTTDFVLNNPTGPFNNMGVPGARSFHLLAPGYGNLANFPAAANPYFIRMTGSTPNASVLELSMAQAPTFFSLWIGNNDVLGYALSGGDGTSSITDQPTFDFAISTLVTTLTSGGAKGVMANIPYVSDTANFTTIAWNILDPTERDFASLGPQIPVLNAQLYGPLNGIFTAYGEPDRINLLSDSGPNPLLINDENAIDRSVEITTALTPALGAPTAAAFGAIFGKSRQATADDLILLAASSAIGEPVLGAPSPVNINGISFPLADKWVLISSEQAEIKAAVDGFNATIQAAANQAGLAFVDANALLSELNTTGIASGNFVLTSNLVSGGVFSLDGVHLTSRGYALAANEFMKAIDATYGSNFEESGNLVDIGDYPTNYSPTLQ